MSEVEVAKTAVERFMSGESGLRAMREPPNSSSVGCATERIAFIIADLADEEALDMLEAAKDHVIVGPAFGLVHNAVYESERAGVSKEVVARMGLPRKLEATCRTYEQIRKRGSRL